MSRTSLSRPGNPPVPWFYDRFIPAKLRCGDVDTRRRARLVVSFTLALAFWSPVFAAIYAWLEAPGLSVAVLMAGVCVMAVPFVMAVTRSIYWSGHLLTLNLFWILMYLGFETDGIRSPAMPWFVAVPILGTLLMGYRAGALWLAVTLATMVATYLIDCPAWPTSQGLDPAKLRLLELSGLLGITVVVFSLTLIYEKLKDQAFVALLAADRAKSEFLANMSHELRTPLTAILGFADLMLDEGGDTPIDGQATKLRTIRRNGEHLLELINDILDLSKIEAGKLQMERLQVSPVKLIDEAVSLMQVRADAKSLDLSVKYEESVPETIGTDPTRLRQILFNLIGNAIKFTKAGDVRIVVRVITDDAGHARLQMDVADTGIGISPDHINRLFEPFTQEDASSSRNFGGTGLGLAISRRLARMLGGDISVESVMGKGSRFRVEIAAGASTNLSKSSLPWKPTRRTVAPDNCDVTATSRPLSLASSGHEAGPTLPLAGIRVLLAEDGPDNRYLIAMVLRKAGLNVTVAENGRIAVDAALGALEVGRPFDVILMDMQMPVLDGYAATAELRRASYTLPIIALTAHAMAEDRQKCLNAGCDDYATKPIQREKLLGVIEKFARQCATA